jgi:hypothetical protein
MPLETFFDNLAAEKPGPKSHAHVEASELFIDSNVGPLWLQDCKDSTEEQQQFSSNAGLIQISAQVDSWWCRIATTNKSR